MTCTIINCTCQMLVTFIDVSMAPSVFDILRVFYGALWN